MRGVVFLGERELELREFPDPKPGPGDVVLAMKASGMCGSDLHPYRASRSGGAAKSLGLGGAAAPASRATSRAASWSSGGRASPRPPPRRVPAS